MSTSSRLTSFSARANLFINNIQALALRMNTHATTIIVVGECCVLVRIFKKKQIGFGFGFGCAVQPNKLSSLSLFQ